MIPRSTSLPLRQSWPVRASAKPYSPKLANKVANLVHLGDVPGPRACYGGAVEILREDLVHMYKVEPPTLPKPQIIKRAPANGRTTANVSAGIGLAYERFLELPVWVVLLVMWVGGVTLLGAYALMVYAAVSGSLLLSTF